MCPERNTYRYPYAHRDKKRGHAAVSMIMTQDIRLRSAWHDGKSFQYHGECPLFADPERTCAAAAPVEQMVEVGLRFLRMCARYVCRYVGRSQKDIWSRESVFVF